MHTNVKMPLHIRVRGAVSIVLMLLVFATFAAACSDSEPTPTSTPTHTPTPAPIVARTSTPTSEPTAIEHSTPTFNIDANTEWQEVFDGISTREQSCIRNELDEESLNHALGSPLLFEDVEQWHVSIFECLDSETADVLYLSALSATESLDNEAETCVRGLLADTDVAEIMRAHLPDATPERAAMAEEFYNGMDTCLGDLSPPSGGGTALGPPPPDGSLLWQYETGNPGELVIVSPTLANGVVYASSYEGFVYALDAETGELLWRYETENDQNLPPTAADGIVYVVRSGGELFALDAYTGERLWNDEPVYADSLLSDGIRYMPDLDFDAPSLNVRAIDESSGELRWEAEVALSSELPLIFPLTATGANVYVSDDNQVHAIDSTTGELVWIFDAGDVVDSPPRESDGVVYLRSYSTAYALDESTGEQLWQYDIESYAGPSRPPAVAGGVWALVDGGAVQAIDAATGQPLWSYEDDYVIYVSGVLDGMVFVTGGEAFHALDAATGREMWSLDANWGFGEVTVVDGVLYANSLDGYLHTFDARTGDPFWSVEVGYHLGGADKPYLVSGGVVYVGYQLADSGVYAFISPSGR